MQREDRAEVEPGQTPHNHVAGAERRHVGLCIVCSCIGEDTYSSAPLGSKRELPW